MTPEERNTVIEALELLQEQLKAHGAHDVADFDNAERALVIMRGREPVALRHAWECNECGSQEYTMSVSEDDVQNLGCSNCGGGEWHKAIAED